MDNKGDACCFRREVIRQQPSAPPEVELSILCVGHVRAVRGLLIPEVNAHFVCMVWCVAGQLMTSTDGRLSPIPPGFVSVIVPGTHYSVEILSETGEARYIVFDGAGCEKTLADAGLWSGTFPVGGPPATWLDRIAMRMAETAPASNPLAIVGLFEVLSYTNGAAVAMTPDKMVLEVLRFIHLHGMDPRCTVNRVVKESGVTRSTLARHFKAVTGQTILEYLTTLRLRKAKQLLKTTALPSSDIGMTVGWAEPAYFCRIFRHHAGCSPREFRRCPASGITSPL